MVLRWLLAQACVKRCCKPDAAIYSTTPGRSTTACWHSSALQRRPLSTLPALLAALRPGPVQVHACRGSSRRAGGGCARGSFRQLSCRLPGPVHSPGLPCGTGPACTVPAPAGKLQIHSLHCTCQAASWQAVSQRFQHAHGKPCSSKLAKLTRRATSGLASSGQMRGMYQHLIMMCSQHVCLANDWAVLMPYQSQVAYPLVPTPSTCSISPHAS